MQQLGYGRLQVVTASCGQRSARGFGVFAIAADALTSPDLMPCRGCDARIGILGEENERAERQLNFVRQEQPHGRVRVDGELGLDLLYVTAGEVVQVLGQRLGNGGVGRHEPEQQIVVSVARERPR